LLKKVLFSAIIASSLLHAIDYSKAYDSIKKPEAIHTISKGKDMTMTDVKESVDADKLTEAVIDSKESKKNVEDAKSTVKKAKEVEETSKAFGLF